MLPTIHFCRHGQTDWNVEGRIQGQFETDINAFGHQQADRNGHHLGAMIEPSTRFDFVSSPLQRTRETMRRVRHQMDLDPDSYQTDPLLMEVNFGDWQGLTNDEVEARQPGSLALRAADKWNFLPPGRCAESYAILAARMQRWLGSVSTPTICVTHGGNIRTLFYLIADLDANDAATLEIPQDRVLTLAEGKLNWS